MTRFTLALVPALALAGCMARPPAVAPMASEPMASEPMASEPMASATPAAITVGTFADGPALSVDDALAQSDRLDGQTVRVAGTIRQVCQAMGCWMTFSTAQGQTIRVETHEEGADEAEGITFPKDAAGRHAEVVGTLRVTEESVDAPPAPRRGRRRDGRRRSPPSRRRRARSTLVATGARISM